METNTNTQILNLIDKSQNILLLTHAKADCDGLGSMLSLYLTLKELGKNVTAATNDPAPDNLSFLPSLDVVSNSIASKDFIIKLDTSKNPLSKIKYNMEGDYMNIVITPKGDSFSQEDVSFEKGGAKFDLIVVMDAGSLDHLGAIYDKNTELFFEAPIINIDHHTSNTDFGQINLVDPVASSTTEVMFPLLKEMEAKYNKKFITKDVATLLLAGIITDTGSFQHANTSPQSMEAAADLLDLGGRQQEIIKNIYKTKKLSTLKLWGSVLSKVKVDPVYRMVWSTISEDDLAESGAKPEESDGVVDDLLTNAPGAEVIFLVKYNSNNLVSVSMRSTSDQVNVGKITSEMGGGGHVRAAGFKVRDGRPFDQVVSETIAKIRNYQAKRLNIHQNETEEQGGRTEEPKNRRTEEQKDSQLNRVEKQDVKRERKETYLEFKAKPIVQRNNETTRQSIPRSTTENGRDNNIRRQRPPNPQPNKTNRNSDTRTRVDNKPQAQRVQQVNPQNKNELRRFDQSAKTVPFKRTEEQGNKAAEELKNKRTEEHRNSQLNRGNKQNTEPEKSRTTGDFSTKVEMTTNKTEKPEEKRVEPEKQFKAGTIPKPQFKKFEKREASISQSPTPNDQLSNESDMKDEKQNMSPEENKKTVDFSAEVEMTTNKSNEVKNPINEKQEEDTNTSPRTDNQNLKVEE